nr:hypothetical protein [Tanacetum cinerariifolium]
MRRVAAEKLRIRSVHCYYFIFTLKSSDVYAKVSNGDLLKLWTEQNKMLKEKLYSQTTSTGRASSKPRKNMSKS